MPDVHTINGIRDSASGTTDRVGAMLHDRHDYEWHKIQVPVTHSWGASKKKALHIARQHIIPQTIPGSDVIAHSHGCLLTWAAMYVWHHELRNDSNLFRRILMFSPAMNRRGWDWDILNFEAMRVIYNPFDLAIRLGSWWPGHPFGRAGSRGFAVEDSRIENISKTSFAGPFNHNAPYFRTPYIYKTVLRADQFFSSNLPGGGA